MKLNNPYTLEQTLAKLRFILSVKGSLYLEARELLEKAEAKAHADETYAKQMEEALLHGSTLELRELFSSFGDYMEPRRAESPWYPHRAAVNGIDTALHELKCGANGISVN